jgi:hypothetical protein
MKNIVDQNGNTNTLGLTQSLDDIYDILLNTQDSNSAAKYLNSVGQSFNNIFGAETGPQLHTIASNIMTLAAKQSKATGQQIKPSDIIKHGLLTSDDFKLPDGSVSTMPGAKEMANNIMNTLKQHSMMTNMNAQTISGNAPLTPLNNKLPIAGK